MEDVIITNIIEETDEKNIQETEKIHHCTISPETQKDESFIINDYNLLLNSSDQKSLQKRVNVLRTNACNSEKIFTKKEIHCKLFYYCTGMTTLVLNILILSIVSSVEFSGAELIFILSLASSILSSITNFLKIESKISKLEDYKKSYRDYRIKTWDVLRKTSQYTEEEVESLVKELRFLEKDSGDLKVKLLCF